MEYILLIIIGFLIYGLYKRNQLQVNKVNNVNNVPQTSQEVPNDTIQTNKTPEELREDLDLIQHNQNVMTQLNDYIKLSDTKNYSHDNIALGTANLMDYHDTY